MEYGLGALKSKKDIRDYKFKRKVSMAISYPKEFSCMKEFKIKNQGQVGSCVAHSLSEILEYHYGGTLSTNFIYGIHKKLFNSNGPGMYPREACKIALNYGDPKEELCKGNTEVDEVYVIANKAFVDKTTMEDALKHKIKSYVKLSSMDDIKYALTNYGPVLGTITWYKDYKVNKTTGLLTQGNVESGGHAIVIYGWNEQGWLCQNSWGKTWGKGGCFVLPYSYKLNEAYSLTPGTNEDVKKPVNNDILDIIYKLINLVINVISK